MAVATYQLAPVSGNLSLFNHMVEKYTQTLVLKEKMFDSFDIKRIDGVPIMRGEGKILSWRGRKLLYDGAGHHLYTILRKPFHWPTVYTIEDNTGKPLMEVKSSIKVFGSKASATFTTDNGTPVTFVMKGSWLDTTADIVDETTGAVVARIDRKLLNARELLLGHQTYHLTIAPGADTALLVAMCICFDQKNNEN